MLEEGFTTIVLHTLSTMIFFIFTINFFRYLIGEPRIHIRDVTKQHNWKSIRRETKAYYCSICESLLLNINGLICDSCGVCADPTCVKIADKQLKCKIITLNTNNPMKHHWIKGNLPLNAICHVCNEECDLEPGLIDWWCCWCQRCVHDTCKANLSEICDFGKFKLMVIPPSSLDVINLRSTVRRKLHIRAVKPPNWSHWKPLIVVANKKSGNNDGAEILSLFRRLINPAQVVDLSERDPVALLEWCRLLGKVSCTILVAGGDGTIAWLLSSIHKLGLELLYLCFGTQQVVERECKDLDKSIEIYLDGKKVDLPSIESIVILNIPSWAAGVDLWNIGLEDHEKYGKQSINDEKLEVVALYSSFHMAQLQVGLSQPYRLGQASSIKVKLLKSCAMQIDGEPWYQQPCEFNISYCNKAIMLENILNRDT
ncbi:diacylglycerol kinase epsilon isoform X3 [Megachile rotundata]|uniref:diacylglycerol kinase epsilon isoform X3 n=1 Tax=Megachile rotundata TaxID=143995 RepID=UPI003FD1A315